jgi:hypothetical protein
MRHFCLKQFRDGGDQEIEAPPATGALDGGIAGATKSAGVVSGCLDGRKASSLLKGGYTKAGLQQLPAAEQRGACSTRIERSTHDSG